MLNKTEVKDIQSLSQKKFREERGLFIAEGPKIVSEMAAAAPGNIRMIYALKEWLDGHPGLTERFPVTEINASELERISQLQTPNSVVAVLSVFDRPWPPPGGFSLYLDTIQDPGNMGTIIRIADWFGVKGIVCSSGCADPYSSKVVQSTMASLARITIDEDVHGDWLSTQTMPKYAAVLDGKPVYAHAKVTEGILMIGNESKGLRPSFAAQATEKITIPRIGEAESLNAAVATGIILSHLLS